MSQNLFVERFQFIFQCEFILKDISKEILFLFFQFTLNNVQLTNYLNFFGARHFGFFPLLLNQINVILILKPHLFKLKRIIALSFVLNNLKLIREVV